MAKPCRKGSLAATTSLGPATLSVESLEEERRKLPLGWKSTELIGAAWLLNFWTSCLDRASYSWAGEGRGREERGGDGRRKEKMARHIRQPPESGPRRSRGGTARAWQDRGLLTLMTLSELEEAMQLPSGLNLTDVTIL